MYIKYIYSIQMPIICMNVSDYINIIDYFNIIGWTLLHFQYILLTKSKVSLSYICLKFKLYAFIVYIMY